MEQPISDVAILLIAGLFFSVVGVQALWDNRRRRRQGKKVIFSEEDESMIKGLLVIWFPILLAGIYVAPRFRRWVGADRAHYVVILGMIGLFALVAAKAWWDGWRERRRPRRYDEYTALQKKDKTGE